MKILVLLTRAPWGRGSGRKTVLRTIISSLCTLGHEVELLIFDAPQVIPDGSPKVYWGFGPGLLELSVNAIRAILTGTTSLNEAVFSSKAGIQQVKLLIREQRHDVIVCDMLRLAPMAAAANRPWVLDLDDLLSLRYSSMAQRGKLHNVLGFYADRLPSWLRSFAERIARYLLVRESKILQKREVYWARRASAVALVSTAESKRLEGACGRPVRSAPMAVQIPPLPCQKMRIKGPIRALFVGGIDYQPNLDAIRYCRDAVLPILLQQASEGFSLTVAGYCAENLKIALATKGLNLLGYVESLQDQFSRHDLMLAPIVSGTGIKTKVLEAMAGGLPVVTTSDGIIGLNVVSGIHCIVGDTPTTLAAAALTVARDAKLSNLLAENARKYVMENFSPAMLCERWAQLLADASYPT